MTTQRDLEHRIRARQRKTGESYTTARDHILRAQRELTGGTDPQRVHAIVLRCMSQAQFGSVRLYEHPHAAVLHQFGDHRAAVHQPARSDVSTPQSVRDECPKH